MCAEKILLIPKIPGNDNAELQNGRKFTNKDISRISNLFAPDHRKKVKKIIRYLLKTQPFQIASGDFLMFGEANPAMATSALGEQTSLIELIKFLIESRTEKQTDLKEPIDYELFLSAIDDKNKRWFQESKKKTLTKLMKKQKGQNNDKVDASSMHSGLRPVVVSNEQKWLTLYSK